MKKQKHIHLALKQIDIDKKSILPAEISWMRCLRTGLSQYHKVYKKKAKNIPNV